MRGCQEITLLIEKRKFKSLPVMVRMELFMHKKMCSACNRYAKDSKTLDKILANRRIKMSKYEFTEAEKQKIIELNTP